MANGVADSISPFFSIWIEPRATIRRIVDSDPTRHVVALAAIGPALNSLLRQWSGVIDGTASPSVLWPLWVVFNVVVQAAVGVVFLYIFAALMRWSGSLLGGTASNLEMRAAVAWSQVPGIFIGIVLLVALFAGAPMPKLIHGRFVFAHFSYTFMIVCALGIWGFVISLKCFGEVHRFSAWRALAAIVILPFIIAIIAIVVWLGIFLFTLLAGRRH